MRPLPRLTALLTVPALLALRAAAAAPQAAEPRLIAPTQGRPVFVAPGGTLAFALALPDAAIAGPLTAELVSDREPGRAHRLLLHDDASQRLAAGEPIVATVPAATPDETFTLRVGFAGMVLEARHCVAVGALGESIRVVHLGDMNVGEPAAPQFDDALADELNLVAPTVIVATGDYLHPAGPDPAPGWVRLSDWLSRCDAPAILACGDRDDPACFARFAAASPVGEVSVGPLTALVLLDHAAHPLADDPEQRAWADAALRRSPGGAFIVAHASAPSLLHAWMRDGRIGDPILARRTIAYLVGGATDWDGVACQPTLRSFPDLCFSKTHAASTTQLDGARGIPHYRVIDMTADRAWVRSDPARQVAPPSIPVGSLRAFYDGPNDGSAPQVGVTLVNALPVRINAVSARLRVRRGSSAALPECRGATLVSCVGVRGVWECRVRADLPDRSAVRVRVGYDLPRDPPVTVEFDVPPRLEFSREAPDASLFAACTLRPVVRITSCPASATPPATAQLAADASPAAPPLTPLVRLDGAAIPYRTLGSSTPFTIAAQYAAAPGESVALELDLSALPVRPGQRELQVYPRGGDGDGPPFTQRVELEIR